MILVHCRRQRHRRRSG